MAGRQGPARRRVVAWGTSVLASALVAAVGKREDLDLTQVEATLPAALAALGGGAVHAVVCDLASVPAACVLQLLAEQPQLIVVIVEPDGGRGLVLSCRRPRLLTIDDLVAVLLNGDVGGDARVARPAGATP
jgi:uncharacterized protein (DUF2336 family)